MKMSWALRLLLSVLALLVGSGLVAVGCTTNEGDVHNYYSLGGAPAEPSPEDGYKSYLPSCSEIVDLEDLDIDLFGNDGHRFYFEVTPDARMAADEQRCNFGDAHGAVYDFDGGEGICPLEAINVRIHPSGSKICSDTGTVELDLPGQSSFRPWAEIPNFKLDVAEFEELLFPTGERQLRFNNGQADSTIVREAVALRIWRALDYPAPRTSFVQTRSNVWDTEVRPGASAAHVMVEPYKEHFFTENLPEVRHVWEGQGDPFVQDSGGCEFGCCDPFGCGGDIFEPLPMDDAPADVGIPEPGPGPVPGEPPVGRGSFSGECQWSVDEECDEAAFDAILAAMREIPSGPGYMGATQDYLDWPLLHRNMCLSALTGTGDDWIHNTNNVVLALRDDGKLIFLPYSTDISGNHPWYQNTPYQGFAHLTQACQADPECWEQALSTCETMIDEFEALDVVETIVNERCEALRAAELDRPADEPVCKSLGEYYAARPGQLREELQWLRDGGSGVGGDQGLGGYPVEGPLK